MSLDSDVQTRITVALPPLDERAHERAAEQDSDLTRLDPQDPDERSLLIRLAHPDLDDAIDKGHDELIVDGMPMNPRLHVAIHEVVAAQIIDNDPPEVLATAQRLLALGRDTHEVLHMLGSAVAEQIWTATHEQRPYDRGEHMRALTALPDPGTAGSRRTARSARTGADPVTADSGPRPLGAPHTFARDAHATPAVAGTHVAKNVARRSFWGRSGRMNTRVPTIDLRCRTDAQIAQNPSKQARPRDSNL